MLMRAELLVTFTKRWFFRWHKIVLLFILISHSLQLFQSQIKTDRGTDADHNNRDFVKPPIPGLLL
jgi:hypothetical protein